MRTKHKLLAGLTATWCAVLMASCAGEDSLIGNGAGTLSLQVDLDTHVVSASTSRAVSTGDIGPADITVNDLSLSLKSTDKGSYENTWTSISEFNANPPQLPVGSYQIKAWYGAADAEGFGCPALEGQTDIVIRDKETTSVKLPVRITNCAVQVAYTNAFTEYMTSWSAKLKSTGHESHDYMADDAEAGRLMYLEPGEATLNVTFTKPSGAGATVEVARFDTEARHRYLVTVDYNEGEVGKGSITVTFDDTMAEEPVVIDISDDILNQPAPIVTAVGFTSGEPIDFVPGMVPAEPYKINIMARGRIAKAVLTTTSATLLAQGWPAEVDLASATGDQQATLEAFGLKTLGLWRNPDVMAVVDLSGVLDYINVVDGDEIANTTTFSFTVTDKMNKTIESPIVLQLKAEALNVAITETAALAPGIDELDVTVSYNGPDPDKNVKIQYKNDRGTWTDCDIVSVTPAASRASSSYIFRVKVPADKATLVLRAVVGKPGPTADIPTITVSRTGISVAADNLDVMATSAILTVKGNGFDTTQADIMLSTDGGTTYAKAASTVMGTAAASTHAITGLTAGTTYTAKAVVGEEETATIEFTTETAAQVPDGGLETWTRTNGKTNYWWIEYPADGWATLNPLTTSEGGNTTSAFSSSRNGCSYNAYSGTRCSDSAHEGEHAAIIETVGWGAGNSATGSCNSSTCKYVNAGELYLGTYNNGANYGLEFVSRPSSMTFWYKYTPKNNEDYGTAEISVYDSEGNVIATASTNLTTADEYTVKTLDLNYTIRAKAAKLHVKFCSSGNSSCLIQSNDNLSTPAFGNTSTGRFTGSSLYIDDITLNY